MEFNIISNSDFFIENNNFMKKWKNLYLQCSWSTPYQSPEYVTTWFDSYKIKNQLIFVSLNKNIDEFSALLVLSISHEHPKKVSVAGAHQAEYQCWLEDPSHSGDFIMNAISLLYNKKILTSPFKIKYAPNNIKLNNLINHDLVIIEKHNKPIKLINKIDVERSFKKKSNKSKINRLSKLGDLSFTKLTDHNEFCEHFESIIESYDLRQGSKNASFPFLIDNQKKEFHINLIKNHPEMMHITILKLNNKPISSHIGLIGKDQVHLSILSFSPFYSSYSPGKIHIMKLSRLLYDDNKDFDLTPGNDPWKYRFSNHIDHVYEISFYGSKTEKHIAIYKEQITKEISKKLKSLNIKPSEIKNKIHKIRKININYIIEKIKKIPNKKVEMRIYRLHKEEICFNDKGIMSINSIKDILMFEPEEIWQEKQSFSNSSLTRLENNNSFYSFSENNKLLHYGWLAKKQKKSIITEVNKPYTYPDNSAVLFDFYTSKSARGRGLYQSNIKQILGEITKDKDIDYIYILVESDNIASRHVIEKLGFTYIESLYSN